MLKELHSQALANTARTTAKVGYASPVSCDAIAEVAETCLKELHSQALVNTARTFAKAGHASPVVFDVIAEVAET
eukprot:12426461-Karenia_brevis.AAC.1